LRSLYLTTTDAGGGPDSGELALAVDAAPMEVRRARPNDIATLVFDIAVSSISTCTHLREFEAGPDWTPGARSAGPRLRTGHDHAAGERGCDARHAIGGPPAGAAAADPRVCDRI
jgi:hypothetical protein